VGGAVKGDRIHLSLNAGNPTCSLPQGDLNPSIRKQIDLSMITSEPEGDDQVAMITGTRSGILETLKRAGSLTAADLAREMGVSAIAARQHLSVLEAEGLVEASLRRKSGVGRPSSVYHLTEKGQETFPRLYDEFLLLVLKGVREIGGVSGMKALLDWRTEETDRHYGPQLR